MVYEGLVMRSMMPASFSRSASEDHIRRRHSPQAVLPVKMKLSSVSGTEKPCGGHRVLHTVAIPFFRNATGQIVRVGKLLDLGGVNVQVRDNDISSQGLNSHLVDAGIKVDNS